FDPRPPRVTSGLRIGTPALATRGFGDEQFTEVADIIATALKDGASTDDAALSARVAKLTAEFPLYPGLCADDRTDPGREGHRHRHQSGAQGAGRDAARPRRRPGRRHAAPPRRPWHVVLRRRE